MPPKKLSEIGTFHKINSANKTIDLAPMGNQFPAKPVPSQILFSQENFYLGMKKEKELSSS